MFKLAWTERFLGQIRLDRTCPAQKVPLKFTPRSRNPSRELIRQIKAEIPVERRKPSRRERTPHDTSTPIYTYVQVKTRMETSGG